MCKVCQEGMMVSCRIRQALIISKYFSCRDLTFIIRLYTSSSQTGIKHPGLVGYTFFFPSLSPNILLTAILKSLRCF